MITRNNIQKLQSIVNQKAYEVGQRNNEKTRKEFDEAVNNLIAAEKDYATQRKTKEIEYSISIRPLGSYSGVVTVWEDSTKEEIKQAVLNDCEYYISINY